MAIIVRQNITGRLRRRIDIEQPTAGSANAYGETVDAWAALLTNVPAEVITLSGREALRMAQVAPEVSYRVAIRYRSNVTSAMRVKWGTVYLYPVSIEHDPRQRITFIYCSQQV